jgi:hypothetical protein
MKKIIRILLLMQFIFLSLSSFSQNPTTPPKGSKDRKEILDIFREDFGEDKAKTLFRVEHFLIQNGWACAYVTPLQNNVEIADSRWDLFQLQNGKWVQIKWYIGVELNDDFELIDLPSQYSRVSKIIVKKYPSCPMAIFPK